MSRTKWAPLKLTMIAPSLVLSPVGSQGPIIAEMTSKGNLRQSRPLSACRLAAAQISSRESRVAALKRTDIDITRLRVNLESPPLQGEIEGRDFDLALEGRGLEIDSE